MSFSIKTPNLVFNGSINFQSDLQQMGEAGLRSEKERMARGVDNEDRSGKSLAKSYRTRKLNHGVNPIRDFRLTGKRQAEMNVRPRVGNQAEIGFVNPQSQRIADISGMVGLSPSDERVVERVSAEAVGTRIDRELIVK